MDICGNVLVSKDILNFALKCLYCETDIEEWDAFVNHIQSLHNTNYEEPCIDPLVELDYKENIVVGLIKDEIMTQIDTTEFAVNDPDVKMEFQSDGESVKSVKSPGISCIINNFKSHIQHDDSTASDVDQSQDNDANYVDTDTDSSDEDGKKDMASNKKFNPTFYRRNTSTTIFIELYKKAPCLWDPSDDLYNNSVARENCQKEIIEEMKKRCQVILTDQTVKSCFRKLHMQYQATHQAKQKKTKSKTKKLPSIVMDYFQKCSFLSVAKDDLAKEVEETPITNTNLSFAKLNPVTETFIETYALFPVLYNTKHEDYNNSSVRKQTYKEMSNIIKSKQNIEFSDDDIYKGIYYLRHWYYKLKNRLEKDLAEKDLSSAAQIYMKKCAFLPTRAPNLKLKCTECNKVFQNETTRQSHLFREHNIGDWPHKCTECGRTFEFKATLLMHEQRSHVGKVHKCDYCERRFAVQVDLQRHIGTHTGQKPFVCELCGKAFRSKTQLGYHSDAIHTKTRAYKCTMCPKDFLKARDLKDHIKAHLNIRDKICETCGKGFTNCHSLIRHRQIHSEIKKFACKLCEAKFHQFVGLNSHMKRTHGIVKSQQKS